jgi:DNA-binding NtrC family response regulator
MRLHEVTVDREVLLQLGNTRVLMTPLDDTVELPIASATRFGALRGQSVAMRRVFDRLALLAPTELTILISGESGTGKELAAEALHEASARARGPFRIVDCGALPGTLIESELYGHVRGAFTGADRAREGAFESAAGGTLFLDEIGELPLELQPRLLGALERRRVQAVGATQSIAVDVRVIAASNRDLRREVSRGTFREDLFFRLAVATVEMPSLRDRPDDIPLYVDEFSEGRGQLDVDTLERLRRERWPGNVRELRNAVERALLLGNEPTNVETAPEDVEQLTASIDAAVPYKIGKGLLIEKYDRIYLEGLIRRHRGNVSQAARAAEIDRVYLLRLLDRFGMRPSRT